MYTLLIIEKGHIADVRTRLTDTVVRAITEDARAKRSRVQVIGVRRGNLELEKSND
jgi:hypothetical protein